MAKTEDPVVKAPDPRADSGGRRVFGLGNGVHWATENPEDAPALEAFRRVHSLLATPAVGTAQVVVVTSAVPGDGKTTLACNLALIAARDDKARTLLVDADLRRPHSSAFLEPTPKVGLTDVLTGRARVEDAIVHVREHSLDVMGSGQTDEHAGALLTPVRAQKLVDALRKDYRWVIIDTPPALLFADAGTLASHTDGVLLVVRSGWTPMGLYKEAIAAIGKENVLGTILNVATPNLVDRTRHSDYYYKGYYKRGSSKKR